VFVEAADGRVAEEDTAAAVGLEAMLVRIDDDGVGVGYGVEGGTGFGREIRREGEIATVGGVDVDAEFVFFLKRHDLVERIDGADSGGPQCNYYCCNYVSLQKRLENLEVHAAMLVGGNRDERQAEDAADAVVSVVGLIGGGDCPGSAVLGVAELASDPEGLEVCEGASAAEMTQMLRPVEHIRERSDGFDLHGGAGATAVEGVIVGVDRHGQGVGDAGDWVRRLQHLSRVEGMSVGKVVAEANRCLLQNVRGRFAQRGSRVGWQMGEAFVQSSLGFGEELEEIVWHGLL
jgi:hypothetical protein